MAQTPLVSIVIPVYDRDFELRRALDSIVQQSYGNFDCIVVDDSSSIGIEDIVNAYDSRFRHVRNSVNLGCTGARLVGYRHAKGEYLSQLDSDNQLFPWAIERGVRLLESEPCVGGVSGQFMFTDGIRVSLESSPFLVTPEIFAAGKVRGADMVPLVRRFVVEQWLAKESDYFNTDFHIWLTHHMTNQHIFVDEVWGRFNDDAQVRISKSVDPRNLRDVSLFVREHRPLLGTQACRPLDEFLYDRWNRTRGTAGGEHNELVMWMRERGLSKRSAAAFVTSRRFRRLGLRATSRAVGLLERR